MTFPVSIREWASISSSSSPVVLQNNNQQQHIDEGEGGDVSKLSQTWLEPNGDEAASHRPRGRAYIMSASPPKLSVPVIAPADHSAAAAHQRAHVMASVCDRGDAPICGAPNVDCDLAYNTQTITT
jgi:hypothetical protein